MVTVRPALPSDEDAFVRGALGNAWESERLRLDEAVVRRAVRKMLADPAKGLGFVAEDSVEPEGLGALSGRTAAHPRQAVGTTYVTSEWSDWHDAWYWWIQSLYVVPPARGQGVYTAMYRFLLEQARQAGDVRSVRLYVERDNEAALRAYRGHGMAELPYLVFEQALGPAPSSSGKSN
jgi:ribosomal protein S18 acetylase RimI-like enzyme